MKKLIIMSMMMFSSLLLAEVDMIENYIIEGQTKKKAELSLTVKKINSKELNGTINKENKEIMVKIKDEGEIVVFETLDQFSSYTVEGEGNNFSKLLNINNEMNRGKTVKDENYTYTLYNFETMRALKIVYDVYPENLYLGVLDKNKNVQNVYELNLIEESTVEPETSLIVEQPDTMIFEIKTNKNLRTSKIADYTARTILTFQTEDTTTGASINAEVTVPYTTVTLTEENPNKAIGDLEKIEVIDLKATKIETANAAYYNGVAYEITGTIRGTDIEKIPNATSAEGIDMRFAGKAIVQILIQ